MGSSIRWLVVASLVTSCSFITDFNPDKANNGGAGGMSGSGGMSTGGNGGSGGMSIDAAPDARREIDAAIDARPDAPLVCTSSTQCDDGFICTSDSCSFGMCHYMDNGYCATQNQCTLDRCNPSATEHDSCGCSRMFIQCSGDQICLADQGCVNVTCSTANPCPDPADCCFVSHCEGGTCRQVARCPQGQTCSHLPDPQCGVPSQCTCQ